MKRIFISYRRDDAKADARGLRDRLAGVFGAKNIFMDVDNLLIGQRFDQELEKALEQCDVFLAVMGPRWMRFLDERRAGGERDYVREEIAAAIKRGAIVIPVLVDDAPIPSETALPDDLRELALYQAHNVTHGRFGRDVDDLITGIKASRQARGEGGGGARLGMAAAAILLIGVAAAFGSYFYYKGLPSGPIQQAKTETPKTEKVIRAPNLKPKVEERFPFEPEIIRIPDGMFSMGCVSGKGCQDDEKPVHRVTVPSFEMGKYEVTFDDWDACIADGGCSHKPNDQGWGRGKRPVISVTWDDITKQYLPWLNKKTGKHYRLPTEAEWEYAARGGTTGPFSWKGKISTSKANYRSTGTFDGSSKGKFRVKTVSVNSFDPNPFGLYNVHGNVWEWCADNWHPNYQGAPQDGSVWEGDDAPFRVLRGGSWGTIPEGLRSAVRFGVKPEGRFAIIGFRIARTLTP